MQLEDKLMKQCVLIKLAKILKNINSLTITEKWGFLIQSFFSICGGICSRNAIDTKISSPLYKVA